MTGYYAYNPVSKTVPESYTSLRDRKKKIESRKKMANPMLHHHSNHTWVYVMHFTLSDLFFPHNSSRGWYCKLPCKIEKTEYIETDFSVTCSTSPFCTASLVKIITNAWIVKVSPGRSNIPCNSQKPTVSQKVLQGDSHLWKDVIISYSKIPSARHLKVKCFPIGTSLVLKQTIYSFVLRIMWLSVDKIVAIWGRLSLEIYLSKLLNHMHKTKQMNKETKTWYPMKTSVENTWC